jgi:transposase-like protein
VPDLAPQIITGVFALGGGALGAGLTWLGSRANDKRRLAAEDDRRWLADRRKVYASYLGLAQSLQEEIDDAACLDWLWRTRYSEDGLHAHCERCGVERTFWRYETKQRRQSWTCTSCGLHVHPTAGTIFHKSSTSLHLWFYAMYLMTSTRCGISAKQLERELGVTYKTAWRMFHLIRHELMDQGDIELSGSVEADETYVGGKRKGSGWPA